ncbi:MAG: hypothetical protein A6F71_02710 [Cycloclasticus sp. symbiont of Poecilosclerida sp. M]|nr:MAG: hypothetical protein A6F71_02710 [Cycloclasticus sp. symbiont of Poecilosclerida sp. M]
MAALKASCAVYKTSKRDGLYLYIKEQDEFSDVPEDVMIQFPTPEHVIDLELSESRALAQEDVVTVINNLDEQGFHLQMPKGTEEPIDNITLPDILNG